MRMPKNTGSARGRNQAKPKPTGFTFNWNLPPKAPAVPPSNLQSLTDGSNISFVSPKHQQPNTEEAGESLSESKNSQSSKSSCTPNQQGDEVINFINQKTVQPAQISKLTSIKMSQANHALQLHKEALERFTSDGPPSACRSAFNARNRATAKSCEPPKKTCSLPMSPFAQLGYSSRVRSTALPLAFKRQDDQQPGCSNSAQRLGLSGIFQKGGKSLNKRVMKTQSCNVWADSQKNMRIKLEDDSGDVILKHGCRMWGADDGCLVIAYDCSENAVSESEGSSGQDQSETGSDVTDDSSGSEKIAKSASQGAKSNQMSNAASLKSASKFVKKPNQNSSEKTVRGCSSRSEQSQTASSKKVKTSSSKPDTRKPSEDQTASPKPVKIESTVDRQCTPAPGSPQRQYEICEKQNLMSAEIQENSVHNSQRSAQNETSLQRQSMAAAAKSRAIKERTLTPTASKSAASKSRARNMEDMEFTDSTKHPTLGDEEDSLMTDDLSETGEEEEDTDQGEGEPEVEEEEMFVTPGKDTSMYHSALYLPQENEHNSEVNESVKGGEQPEVPDKQEKEGKRKRAHPCSVHSCGSMTKSRKQSEDTSVYGASHQHSIASCSAKETMKLISSSKLWPPQNENKPSKVGDVEYSDSTRPPTLNDLSESCRDVKTKSTSRNTSTKESCTTESTLAGPASMIMKVYRNESGENVWELALKFK